MTSTTTGNSMPDTGNNKADLVGQGSGVGSALSGGRNVSVTPINMSDTQFNNGQFSYSSNGIRISVPSEEQRRMGGNISIEDEDSNDAEVSKIDFSQHPYQVNMRTKKKRPSSSTLSFNADGQSQDNGTVGSDRDRERPMSWEGELSDSEMLVDSNPSGTPDALHGTNKTPHSDLEFRLGPQKDGNGYCLKTEPIERDNSFAAANRHNSVSFQSLNDHDALNLKYGNSHHPMLQAHQRSHSMNRVSILSNDNNLDIKSSPLLQQKSTQENIDDENPSEPMIKNMPVNIIPKTLSNKMASEAQAYAAKRELMQQTNISEIKPELPCLVDKFLGGYSLHSTPSNSPLLNRHHKIVSNPSTDSAIHSVYTHSVYSSPSASPGATRHAQYTPSLSRNNSDASHSSCYSYSSEFSPTNSPVQSRHPIPSHPAAHHLFRSEHGAFARQTSTTTSSGPLEGCIEGGAGSPDPEGSDDRMHHHQGVSRQQLINSPCPICGDKISGFHYGIFSCESCKGFFKRTVQNRKNYVCLRGANCPVTVATRKKCPACRFDKCLHCGMKLEAIREDRTRGGRSTYQCSYTLSSAASTSSLLGTGLQSGPLRHASSLTSVNGPSSHLSYHSHHDLHSASLNSMQLPLSRLAQSGVKSEPGSHVSQAENIGVPPLLQEIMDVEHLWQYNESELTRLNKGQPVGSSTMAPNPANNPLLHAAGVPADASPDFLSNLCNIADHRLYKIVKWCKSLPLFKNISIDDQICLLINSWCELLVLSCCYRGVSTPGEVRVGGGNRGITLQQSAKMGLTPCIERMLHFTDHLRRLRVDRYEYVAMKVIVLLNSDTSDLKEPEKVRASQEKALQALQAYTLAHYHETPAKFGELLLRIPELQKTCQVGKEMLNPSNKNKDGETSSFNLLMELLRGDH